MNTNQPKNTPIDSLITGYRKFRTKHFEQSNAFKDLVQHGQKPTTLVIACCDSRVDPAIVTNCKPGELFVVRNVANLVPPYDNSPNHHGTSAALEFGVLGLHINDIIVFGHSHCGGIQALMDKSENKSNNASNFICSWMDIAQPAKQHVLDTYPQLPPEAQAHHCEKESLIISLNNLTSFPWIKERIDSGKLATHAWYFNLNTGLIETYQPSSNDFTPLG